MVKKVSVALLISTYNWPEALKQVLLSVQGQTLLTDEIIIADDGSLDSTRQLIDSFRDKFNIPIKHVWHHDDGFRKTSIMNQAIAHTKCDYIIQIDGDMIPDPHFIEDHFRIMEKGVYIRGSRVLLGPEKSKYCLHRDIASNLSAFQWGIKNRINALRIPFAAPLFTKRLQKSHDFHGSNCAYWRSDFVKVNGYNNEMRGWGHEDIELAARFINSGMRQKRVKMRANCYHLHHYYNDRHRADINFDIYKETVRTGLVVCPDGYNQSREILFPMKTALLV